MTDRAEFKATVSPDGISLTLEMMVAGKPVGYSVSSADEIDGLIGMLAEMRAKMADQVPAELDDNSRVQAISNPRWRIPDTREQNHKLLGLRHPGLGWLWFQLPENEAAGIAEWLTKK